MQMNSDTMDAAVAKRVEQLQGNACIEFFRDKNEDRTKRQRWMNNATFVMAMLGALIGLGNFWRFPYLCFKWGGALFFVPYLGGLFFLGIPMLMLELGMG